ncbi:hypothetical protein ACGC1H_003239 [Rhizoctonia solani]
MSIAGNPKFEGLLDRSRFEDQPGELLGRIIQKPDDGGQGFQFPGCVRRLTVARNMNEQELQDFGSAVLKMKNLEHLGWIVLVVHKIGWYKVLVQLCQKLFHLRSLSLVIAQNEILLGDSEEAKLGMDWK